MPSEGPPAQSIETRIEADPPSSETGRLRHRSSWTPFQRRAWLLALAVVLTASIVVASPLLFKSAGHGHSGVSSRVFVAAGTSWNLAQEPFQQVDVNFSSRGNIDGIAVISGNVTFFALTPSQYQATVGEWTIGLNVWTSGPVSGTYLIGISLTEGEYHFLAWAGSGQADVTISFPDGLEVLV